MKEPVTQVGNGSQVPFTCIYTCTHSTRTHTAHAHTHTHTHTLHANASAPPPPKTAATHKRRPALIPLPPSAVGDHRMTSHACLPTHVPNCRTAVQEVQQRTLLSYLHPPSTGPDTCTCSFTHARTHTCTYAHTRTHTHTCCIHTYPGGVYGSNGRVQKLIV